MADGLNRVILIGNLGADPELKFTQSGNAILELRLAMSESWFDKDTSERKEKTEWMGAVLWGKRAEGLAKIINKGDRICVEGSLQTREWEDKSGNKRFTTAVRASNVVLCGGKREGGGGRHPQQNQTEQERSGGGGGFMDDDIPF